MLSLPQSTGNTDLQELRSWRQMERLEQVRYTLCEKWSGQEMLT